MISRKTTIALSIVAATFFLSGCLDSKDNTQNQEVKDISNTSADNTSKRTKKIREHLEAIFFSNPNYELNKLTIKDIKDVKQVPGWKVYFVELDLKGLNERSKDVVIQDKIFSNGKYAVTDFVSTTNRASLKNKYAPNIDESFYREDRLLYGNKDAENKIVVFSDPVCPVCIEYMPKLLIAAKENPEKIALYYYHLPLDFLHPVASTLSRAAIVAHKKGLKDTELLLYRHPLDIKNDAEAIEAINAFNKKLNTDIVFEDIISEDIDSHLELDKEMSKKAMISGTPTVYVNGKKDSSRDLYLKLIKD